MSEDRPRRVLVVTDHAEPTAELLTAIRQRADADESRFRVIVLNPARAEIHLLHPERHDLAEQAEAALRQALPGLEDAARGPVIGSVSVRHDPMDAIEEAMFDEPVDEVLIGVPGHRLAARLHQDLPHRLAHFGVPVKVLGSRGDAGAIRQGRAIPADPDRV